LAALGEDDLDAAIREFTAAIADELSLQKMLTVAGFLTWRRGKP